MRILEPNPAAQFTADGKRSVESLLFYLWDNPEIQKIFTDNYMIQYSNEQLRKDRKDKVKSFFDLIINHLFVEHTSLFPDWRIVEIQQKLIEGEIRKAQSIEDISKNQLLNIWFETLTNQNEALRCVHYMFKQKMDKVDFNFLTWHNLLKVYQKYYSHVATQDEFEMVDECGSIITNESDLK